MKVNRHKIADALRVAADQYESDALEHSQPPDNALMNLEARRRMVEAFETQARETRAVADAIERAEPIEWHD